MSQELQLTPPSTPPHPDGLIKGPLQQDQDEFLSEFGCRLCRDPLQRPQDEFCSEFCRKVVGRKHYKCDNCKELWDLYPAAMTWYSKHPNLFCSTKCEAAFSQIADKSKLSKRKVLTDSEREDDTSESDEEFECSFCEELLSMEEHYKDNYCSKSCYDKALGKVFECGHCGDDITIGEGEVVWDSLEELAFCNQRCKEEYYKQEGLEDEEEKEPPAKKSRVEEAIDEHKIWYKSIRAAKPYLEANEKLYQAILEKKEPKPLKPLAEEMPSIRQTATTFRKFL